MTYVRFSHLYTFCCYCLIIIIIIIIIIIVIIIYLFIYLFICTGYNPTDSGVIMGSFAVNERNMRREKGTL